MNSWGTSSEGWFFWVVAICFYKIAQNKVFTTKEKINDTNIHNLLDGDIRPDMMDGGMGGSRSPEKSQVNRCCKQRWTELDHVP